MNFAKAFIGIVVAIILTGMVAVFISENEPDYFGKVVKLFADDDRQPEPKRIIQTKVDSAQLGANLDEASANFEEQLLHLDEMGDALAVAFKQIMHERVLQDKKNDKNLQQYLKTLDSLQVRTKTVVLNTPTAEFGLIRTIISFQNDALPSASAAYILGRVGTRFKIITCAWDVAEPVPIVDSECGDLIYKEFNTNIRETR